MRAPLTLVSLVTGIFLIGTTVGVSALDESTEGKVHVYRRGQIGIPGGPYGGGSTVIGNFGSGCTYRKIDRGEYAECIQAAERSFDEDYTVAASENSRQELLAKIKNLEASVESLSNANDALRTRVDALDGISHTGKFKN